MAVEYGHLKKRTDYRQCLQFAGVAQELLPAVTKLQQLYVVGKIAHAPMLPALIHTRQDKVIMLYYVQS
jgi:hypothetical protein